MVRILGQDVKPYMDSKVYNWWNGLTYSNRKTYENDLDRLGMDITHDQYYFSTYNFRNLQAPTRRAIERLYKERFEVKV